MGKVITFDVDRSPGMFRRELVDDFAEKMAVEGNMMCVFYSLTRSPDYVHACMHMLKNALIGSGVDEARVNNVIEYGFAVDKFGNNVKFKNGTFWDTTPIKSSVKESAEEIFRGTSNEGFAYEDYDFTKEQAPICIEHFDAENRGNFIIFSDVDGTFFPMDLGGMERFRDIVGDIEEAENVKVKLCLVSGRPTEYIRAVMDSVDVFFRERGIDDLVDYGVGDQGSAIIHKDATIEPELAFRPGKNQGSEFLDYLYNFKKIITECLNENGLDSSIIKDEQGKVFTCNFRDARCESDRAILTTNELYDRIDRIVKDKFGNKISVSRSRTGIEIGPSQISKSQALVKVINKYQRERNEPVATYMYAGDADNDIQAIRHCMYAGLLASREPSKIVYPGNCKVFVPLNAKKSVQPDFIEKADLTSRIVEMGKKNYFEGIMDCIEQHSQQGTLLTNNTGVARKMKQALGDVALRLAKDDVLVDRFNRFG